jgi:hypothetical protein
MRAFTRWELTRLAQPVRRTYGTSRDVSVTGRESAYAIAVRAGNRSEFGEEFGEGSLEPLTRAAERSRTFGEAQSSREALLHSAASPLLHLKRLCPEDTLL